MNLSSRLVPLAACYALFVATLAASTAWLPDRVASHFGMDGEPNGWMDRGGYLLLMGISGLVLASLAPLLAFLTPRLPRNMVNIPHREYWLAPNNVQATTEYLSGFALRIGWLGLLLMLGLHLLVVQANQQQPVRLSSAGLWTLMALFLTGVLASTIALVLRFSRVRG
jgi:uncharacterized membrane protein